MKVSSPNVLNYMTTETLSGEDANEMKRSGFSDTQVLAILKQAEAGMAVADICHQLRPPQREVLHKTADLQSLTLMVRVRIRDRAALKTFIRYISS